MILRHKPSECIGCDLCADTAPEYFMMDEDGMATLVNISKSHGVFTYSDALEIDRELLEQAEEGCPVGIIELGIRN